MDEAQPAIEVRNIVKTFGTARAIDDVSLRVDGGIFLTLLGPSGCGKSTLLRTIAGFSKPSSGSIMVNGQDITHQPPHLRPVNMVFQDYALFPHMSVRQNIGFGCEMQAMARADIEERVDAMLNLIRLPDVGNREPGELSGGQRQRVALARALAPDPVSLLLDEPLGALDLKLRVQLQHELKSIQRSTGKTFVFVTHDQEEAMSMSDLVAVMKDGRIEQLDTPREIYARPASSFVAGFVGAANMIAARLVELDTRQAVIEVEDQKWQIPAGRITTPRRPVAGEMVNLMVRPENVWLGPGRHDALTLSGEIKDQTFLGGRVRLICRTKHGSEFMIEARPGMVPDTEVALSFHLRPDAVALLSQPEGTVQ